MDELALYRLLTWLSPAYPTGGYTYSHGLEYAAEAGLVRDRASLAGWIAHIVTYGAGRVDALLFAAAHRAVTAGDEAALAELIALGAAFRASAETALESAAQGAAFLAVSRAAWPDPALDRLAALAAAADRAVVLPIAAAAVCAGRAVPLAAGLTAYLHGFAANLVSAGVRLIPLGQTDGQAALVVLERPVVAAAAQALTLPLDDAGAAAPMVDWTSMQHETQYTRLFRS